MPWCEERLLRKVLFLSLREFRDKHSHIHKRALRRTSKNTLLHLPTRRTQRTRYTRNTVAVQEQRPICKSAADRSTKKGSHPTKNRHISKQPNKVRETKTSRGSHSAKKRQCGPSLQTKQKQPTLRVGKVRYSVKRTHLQQGHRPTSSLSGRMLRSHKTQELLLRNSKHTQAPAPLKSPVLSRTVRSEPPSRLPGPVVKRLSHRPPSWGWSLQTHLGQQRPDGHQREQDDPLGKRPRLQAQRKFAQSPPSSPALGSSQNNQSHRMAVVTCLTRRRPKTEDFLSFLCLRGSAALSSNMAVLPRNTEKDCFTACLTANTKAERIKRTTETRSVRGKSANTFCFATTQPSTRRPVEESVARQQRTRREETQEEKRGGNERRHLLRPRQLSLQLAMVTRISEQGVLPMSAPHLRPGTGTAKKPLRRPCTRLGSSCKSRRQRQRQTRSQDASIKPLSLHHNHKLPYNQHQQRVNKKANTFTNHQNSGKHLRRTVAQRPRTNGSVMVQQSETRGDLRLSRRKRGLPPDSSPGTPNSTSGSSIKTRTLRSRDNNGSLKRDIRQPLVRKDSSSRIGKKTSGDHQERCNHVGKAKLLNGDIAEDPRNKINGGKTHFVGAAAVNKSQEQVSFTNAIANCDLIPAGEVGSSPRGERRQSSRTAARTAKSKTSTINGNSVISAHTHAEPPAGHPTTIKDTNNDKGTRRNKTKCVWSASIDSVRKSSAAKNTSRSVSKDPTVNSVSSSSFCSTSKGSSKGPTHTKSTTSAVKTRSSPRNIQKH